MKTQLLTFFLLISVGVCASLAQVKLTPKDFKAKLASKSNAQLLDVRTPSEYKAGHLATAININYYDSDFIKQCAKLDKNKPLFVYCKRGARSGQAAAKLKKVGFKYVYDLAGGTTRWVADGYKMVL